MVIFSVVKYPNTVTHLKTASEHSRLPSFVPPPFTALLLKHARLNCTFNSPPYICQSTNTFQTMKTSTITFGLGALATAVFAVPLKASTTSTALTTGTTSLASVMRAVQNGVDIPDSMVDDGKDGFTTDDKEDDEDEENNEDEDEDEANVTERESYFGPLNPYIQDIKPVSSDEYEASCGGPPVPYSEIVRRIHLEHPDVAYEAKPNVACKEIKPDCTLYGNCAL
jgi:hypothetical protein